MNWDNYLQELLESEKCLDDIAIDMEGQRKDLPKVVKASVFLLEKMIQKQGLKNIFVFPDDKYIPFLFMLSKVIYNIIIGKIENKYSPESFNPGQILKIGNCVTQFVEIGDSPVNPGQKVIILRFANADRVCCPIDMAPFFQISDTKKRLSKYESYNKARREIEAKAASGSKTLQDLKAIKTHVSASIAYVSTVADSERLSNELRINGEDLFEYLLVAKADYMGDLHFYKGKLVGTPSLIFASQIAHVNETISRGASVQSVIINLNETDVNSQLDDLDVLLKSKIPVLCVSDTVNSLELQEMKNRYFNVWRWDAGSITRTICGDEDNTSERKLRRCMESNTEYHRLKAPELSEAFLCLYKYSKLIDEESAQLNSLFSKLINLAYFTVRNICEIDDGERARFVEVLEEVSNSLEIEKDFIDNSLYKDFARAIECYLDFFEHEAIFPKTEQINRLLVEKKYDSVYIICSNNDNSAEVKDYWENRLAKHGYRPTIYVVYPKEFLNLDKMAADVAILAGWFSGNIVKRIVYGYKVNSIHIFTYECEEKWRRAHTNSWKIGLNSESNNEIIKNSFSDKIVYTNEKSCGDKTLSSEDREALRLSDDFDLIVQESKYKQYVAREADGSGQVVKAKPVGFVGGDFALFTEGHKVLVATKLIFQSSNQIEKKEVDELKVGDFIVVRESDKDLIRDVADKILETNGKAEYRKIASLWREALKIEEAFSSLDDIYNRLIALGCTRNYQTVKNWLQSEDLIIPQDYGDLKFIAELTGDGILLERMNDIIMAGREVKEAHLRAGRILSERLRERIATTIFNKQEIDPFNIWEPIEIELDEVGIVKVLKVIDIGQVFISVESTNSNKVLSEEKEWLLWQE